MKVVVKSLPEMAWLYLSSVAAGTSLSELIISTNVSVMPGSKKAQCVIKEAFQMNSMQSTPQVST
jgi:hypothetical protein